MIRIQHSKQLGLTLIELMIAMALSVVVVFAVGSILVISNQTASVADTLSDTQDSGRFVSDYLTRQVLRAGYNPQSSDFSAFADVCATSGEVICIRDSTSNDTGDRLAIRRLAEAGATNSVTCAGVALTDSAGLPATIDVVVTDVYWIETADGIASLRCQTFDEEGRVRDSAGESFGNAQSLVAGVLAMHILYGQSQGLPTEGELNVSRYLNANQVTDWTTVLSIKLAVLTESQSAAEAQSLRQSFTLLDSEEYVFEDQFARQIFTTSVALRN